MLNSNPQNDRRTSADRRMATSAQTPPTGRGEVVLTAVLQRLANMASVSAIPFVASQLLKEDLTSRAEAGREKYGTFLRTKNGRRAIVDMYQELMDSLMYAQQARLEGDKETGAFVEILISLSAQTAAILDKRG